PKMIEAGFTAYPRTIDFKRMREIADAVGAYLWVDMAHFAGLVAGDAHPSPMPYADIVTTTTHKTLRGPRGAMILCKEEFAKKVDKAIFPGLQGGPHNHTTAGIAVCLGEALKPEFRAYAQQVVANARALAAGLQKENIRPVSGGTDTHLVLADLTARNVAGKAAETALDRAAIYVNKNTIPYDTRSPWDPSGIRLGSPSLTTRGMKEREMHVLTALIGRALGAQQDDRQLTLVRKEVTELCGKFPIYEGLR
ncbi:serine hydroxymethyltransferase, partial [Candidatus Woesearchaeota archaeon]|nr:serine hydroxymethyltransferase [Candidatus Woesearchaeota archaeon]